MATNVGINYGKYYIDSAKFYVDTDVFEKVSIPENFVLTDADSGEIIDDFKKNSLSVPYKNHKVYISNIVKYLKNGRSENLIEKVMFYFPAKVCANYFEGIKKQDVIDVLEFLKSKGYLVFSDANKIFKAIYVKDLDVKCDRKFPRSEIENIKEWNKSLSNRFNGSADYFHLFDSTKQGLGISTYTRDKATISKPFLKFYDKSKEIKKSNEFFTSLPVDIQEELRWNLVYRFEFTMKDKTFFSKYNLTNRLEDIMEVLQEKWNEVGKAFLRHNFEVVLKKPKDVSKLRPIEKILMLSALKHYESGMTENEIFRLFVDAQENKLQKQRMKVLFNRIWYFATVPNEMTRELVEAYERVGRMDRIFGLT